MAAILKEVGACPVCDSLVPRFVVRDDRGTREVYSCPEHGSIGYGVIPMDLKAWVGRLAAVPLVGT